MVVSQYQLAMMINIDPCHVYTPTHCSLLEKSDEPLCLWKATDLEKTEKISSALAASDTRDVIRQVLELTISILVANATIRTAL